MGRFELQTLTDYSDEAILEELRRVAAQYRDGPLTKDAYRKLSPKVSWTTVVRRFGSWGKALKAAGLSHLFHFKENVQRGRAMTDDELIAEMRRVHALTGRDVLTTEDFNNHSVTHAEAVRQRFGSWRSALDKAQIQQAELGKRYTDQACYENIVSLWTHYGRQPQYAELKKPPSTVGPKAYVVRWGSWRRALAAFVDWADSEDEAECPATAIPVIGHALEPADLPRGPQRKEEDCREVRPRLRFKVLERDRFRCLACGRSPATHLNVELQADHIVSAHDGGKTTLENLQTLCRDCNLGKGQTSLR